MLTDGGVYIKFDLETIVCQLKNISLFLLEDTVNCYLRDVTLSYTFSGLSVSEFSSKGRLFKNQSVDSMTVILHQMTFSLLEISA